MQGRLAQWKWCGRCGGGSAHQRTLCRRTKCQQASPGTLLTSLKGGGGWMHSRYCEGKSNLHQSSSESRTDHSCQDRSFDLLLVFWSLCRPLLQKHALPTPPPSNNDQLNHQYTAAVSSTQISVDHQDVAVSFSPMSPCCFGLTVWAFCVLCLGPVWFHGHLMGKKQDKIKQQ